MLVCVFVKRVLLALDAALAGLVGKVLLLALGGLARASLVLGSLVDLVGRVGEPRPWQ